MYTLLSRGHPFGVVLNIYSICVNFPMGSRSTPKAYVRVADVRERGENPTYTNSQRLCSVLVIKLVNRFRSNVHFKKAVMLNGSKDHLSDSTHHGCVECH